MIDADLLRSWNDWLSYRLDERAGEGETLEVSTARCVKGHVEGILDGKRSTRQAVAAVDVALIEARKATTQVKGK